MSSDLEAYLADPWGVLAGHAAMRITPGYVPAYLQGRNPMDNPVADATARAQGAEGDATSALAAKFLPQDPLSQAAPQGAAIPMQGFSEGGSVVERLAQLASHLAGYLKPAVKVAESAPLSDAEHFDLMRRFGGLPGSTNRLSLEDMNRLIGGLSQSPTEQAILGQPELLKNAVNPGTLGGRQVDQLLEGHADGGPVEQSPEAQAQFNTHSSLRRLADAARALNPYAQGMAGEDRARIAANLASLVYGLDKQGNPVLGGRAWTSDQGGTPMGALDALTAVPHGVVQLGATFDKYLPGKSNPQFWSSIDPQWSKQAAERLEQLRQRVHQTAGLGDDKSLEGKLLDAVTTPAAVAPSGAAKVAGEGTALRRVLNIVGGAEEAPPVPEGAH